MISTSEFIALLDTCVLAPMPLCDTLLRLAEEPSFYIPKWSDDILRELDSTLRRMGYGEAQARRRIGAMNDAFDDAVVQGYGCLTAAMTNDPKDRHVLAAAVHCDAHAIITSNKKHFRPESVRPFDIEVLSPDEFLTQCFAEDAGLVRRKLEEQAASGNTTLTMLLTRLRSVAPNFAVLLNG